MREQVRHEDGFTLIELLIVMSVMLILMTLAVPQLLKLRKQGQAADASVGPASVGPASRRSSSIWQDERYDRWMRDEDEIAEKWEYIVGNGVNR